MPELPDIEAYCAAISSRCIGQSLDSIRIYSPFVLRTFDPPTSECIGRPLVGVRRLGKRIVLELERQLFLVIHLMISGRLSWHSPEKVKLATGKIALADFAFESGVVRLTEQATKKRASVHVLSGEDALSAQNPGGVEVLDSDLAAFSSALTRENRTLKRALTSPRLISGIGNAFSDEILFAARLSPLRLTRSVSEEEIERLFVASREVLTDWRDRLVARAESKFPSPAEVTPFRPEFAVHGKYGQPCPCCGKPVQRIRYEQNETNYCAACQNEGRLLADRSLSRLLKSDWPKTLEELEEGAP